jgi:PPOX class probable F420-dependent enzyme
MIVDERFVSLTTYRKNGDGVATTVWIAGDAGALLVVTPTESGKVKRLRNNPRVQLVPCSRSGKVEPGAQPVEGTAEIVADSPALRDAFKRKYGFEYKVIMAIERIVARRQKPRVMLRITVPA